MNISSPLRNSIFLGGVCSRELIKFNVILIRTNVENTNKKFSTSKIIKVVLYDD
jgi:hypothetical protein